MSRIPTFVLLVALAGVPAAARGQAVPGDPPVYDYNDQRPGQSQRQPRDWAGAPPVIPHAVKGLTPVTAKRNACLGCHGRPGATSGPPSAPPSHFVDLRDAADQTSPRVVSSRWNCTACHVPQTDAPPLRD